jgi:CDP-paratose 2-epimerase
MIRILITGGAGFIGTNAAIYYLKKGVNVTIFDNFSRKGSKRNAEFVSKEFKNNLQIIQGDIRDSGSEIDKLVRNSDLILHLAGQVAVTTSVDNPSEDFEINSLGTLNILESIRKSGNNPLLIYSSTNKVYGDLKGVKIIEKDTRYEFKELPFGVSEEMNLDFYSPYGCSKGAADQYVHDYARIYGLNTIVFRQSCIYGPHQFGIEDQGWLAWFMIAALKNELITIYGNGKQVRDALYVDDLILAYDKAFSNIKQTKGQIYNIGGGKNNSISIWKEFSPVLEGFFKKKINTLSGQARLGDQEIYISDIRKSKKDFFWEPKIDLNSGLNRLYAWIVNNKGIIK